MIETVSYDEVSLLINSIELSLPYFGGNKARKILHIEKEMQVTKKNAIVTTGSIQSNHCRVTALVCAKNNWKCKLILHGNKNLFNEQGGNALIMRLCGAEIQFVKPEEIGSAMDESMQNLSNQGYSPYYLYGGGHNKLGVEASIDALKELRNQIEENKIPDHIFLASGTGSTQAGILLGLEQVCWQNTEVHGISIARKKNEGIKSILDSINFIKLEFNSSKILFYDDYLFGGYGIYNKELKEFIFNIASKTGIILDPTYTAKAFFGMLDIIKKQKLTGKFLFWHTGGFLNFNG